MILDVILLILSVLLCSAILLQARGTDAGLAFGGDGSMYRTRRGIEKSLHVGTIVLAVLFFVTALLNMLFTW
ncbi:preprotein translocase subunit SecG [bacterium]|nr:preprotein translocase subunit SecG [bacterium]NBX49548.1 preprotein translocase subunit SecG [bacterium]